MADDYSSKQQRRATHRPRTLALFPTSPGFPLQHVAAADPPLQPACPAWLELKLSLLPHNNTKQGASPLLQPLTVAESLAKQELASVLSLALPGLYNNHNVIEATCGAPTPIKKIKLVYKVPLLPLGRAGGEGKEKLLDFSRHRPKVQLIGEQTGCCQGGRAKLINGAGGVTAAFDAGLVLGERKAKLIRRPAWGGGDARSRAPPKRKGADLMDWDDGQRKIKRARNGVEAAVRRPAEFDASGRRILFSKRLFHSDVVARQERLLMNKWKDPLTELWGVPTDAEAIAVELVDEEDGQHMKFKFGYWKSSNCFMLRTGWRDYRLKKKLKVGDTVIISIKDADGKVYIKHEPQAPPPRDGHGHGPGGGDVDDGAALK